MNMLEIDKEVSNLLKLAHQKQANGRSVLFTATTDLLERRHSELSPNELALMSEILEKLVTSVEMNVRKKLAQRLAGSEDAPIDLIILLANDQIEVAKPVLLLSKLLSDQELLKVIRHKTVQHHLSIASRKKLSSAVSRELVAIGNTKTLLALLSNQDARIDDKSIAALVEKSKLDPEIQPPLIEHPDLPEEMSALMYQWVSDSLKESILNRLNITEEEIATLLKMATDEASEEEQNYLTREKSEKLLVDKLHKAGKLKPSFLMKCLNQGQSSLFEIAFSKLINVPQKIMRSFLYDRGAEALAVSCCAAGIDQSVFLTIYELTRAAQNENTVLSDKQTAEAFEYFKKLDKKRAQMTIQKWVADATRTPIF